MADTFGLSKKQATEAVKALEKMGIIKRIFKTIQMDTIEIYTQIVKENIDYEILKADMKYQYELLDELIEIIVDVVAVHRKSIRISGAEYPYGLVKGKFLKLDSGHIRCVLDSMEKTTTHIANIKAYLDNIYIQPADTLLADTPKKPDYTEKEFLHMTSQFEQLGGTYHEENGYLIPDLRLPAEEEQPIGIWG